MRLANRANIEQAGCGMPLADAIVRTNTPCFRKHSAVPFRSALKYAAFELDRKTGWFDHLTDAPKRKCLLMVSHGDRYMLL